MKDLPQTSAVYNITPQDDRQTGRQTLNSGTAIQVPAKFLSFLTLNTVLHTHSAACDKPTVTEGGRDQRKKQEMKVFPTYHETEERAPVHTWQRWSLKSRWERRTGSVLYRYMFYTVWWYISPGPDVTFELPLRCGCVNSVGDRSTGVTDIIPCLGILIRLR